MQPHPSESWRGWLVYLSTFLLNWKIGTFLAACNNSYMYGEQGTNTNHNLEHSVIWSSIIFFSRSTKSPPTKRFVPCSHPLWTCSGTCAWKRLLVRWVHFPTLLPNISIRNVVVSKKAKSRNKKIRPATKGSPSIGRISNTEAKCRIWHGQ